MTALGERYHQGGGEVFLDKNRDIAIRFTAKERIEDYNNTEEHPQNLDLPKLSAHLLPYLNRLSLTVDYNLYNDQTIEGSVYIDYTEGDEIALNQQIINGYQQAIIAITEFYRPLVMQGEEQQLGNVCIRGDMQNNGVVALTIEKTYYYVNSHQDVVQVLFG